MNITATASATMEHCPQCGSDDLQFWADDGEAPDADYWECSSCKAGGSIVLDDDPTTTVNGLAATQRHGWCQHPTITDQQLLDRDKLIAATTGDANHLKCPDCNEWLYPYDGGSGLEVYAGEPKGAGGDTPW